MTTQASLAGCLYTLNVSMLGEKRKLGDDSLEEFADMTQSDREWLTAAGRIIDKNALKPVRQIKSFARAMLKRYSTPFPLKNIHVVSYEAIPPVENSLTECETLFSAHVNDFAESGAYQRAIDEARRRLGPRLWRRDVYPPDIRKAFAFRWQSFILTPPDENRLTPEIYKRRMAEFENQLNQAKEMAQTVLRNEFAKMVDHLADRLTPGAEGVRPRFKESTIQQFFEFFETFKARDIWGCGDLGDLVERAQSLLEGVDPQSLRTSDQLASLIRQELTPIQTALAENIVKPGGRKIRVRKQAEAA